MGLMTGLATIVTVLQVTLAVAAVVIAGGFAVLAGLPGRAHLHVTRRRHNVGSDRPLPRATLPGEGGKFSAAQTAPRHQQRNRFQQIGLARAIGARQRHKRPRRLQPHVAVVAEIGQRKARNGKGGGVHRAPAYTRMGIST